MNEANTMRSILLACSRGATRLFRNNVGKAWLGRSEQFQRTTQVMLYPGDVVVRKAQLVTYGLTVGSSDLIGWTVRDGKAIFTAVEVKTDTGRTTGEQAVFLAAVAAAGGIAGVARSADDARQLLAGISDER